MKRIVYCIWAVWAIACASLKIMGVISWWWALSPLWMPLAVVFSILLCVFVFSLIVTWREKRKEEKTPDSCATCLFGKTAKYSEDGKCLGEACDGDNIARGMLCKYYQRYR